MAKLTIDDALTPVGLGIDFGTTNCVVSVYLDQESLVIPIDGSNVFPTAMMFEPDLDEPDKLHKVFGIEAKEGATIYPELSVLNVKRRLGTGQKIKLLVDGRDYQFTPEEIAGEILAYLKDKTLEYLEEEQGLACEFASCVITVPANSTDKQKKMTKDAAVLAGFDEHSTYIRLEPAAAAINYAVTEPSAKHMLVYDFGGGTFDACVVGVTTGEHQKEPQISILSTYGDNDLGGNDVDKLIMDMVYEAFKVLTEDRIDLFTTEPDESPSLTRQKKMAVARLEQAAQKAKERLSAAKSTKVTLAPFLQEPEIVNINLEITQEAFYAHRRVNQLTDSAETFQRYTGKNLHDMLAITMECIENCVNASGVAGIDEIFLVGGSSAIPLVSEKITDKFGKAPYKAKLSPALSIAMGASTYTHLIDQSQRGMSTAITVAEKTIHPLGIEVYGRRFFQVVSQGLDIPAEGLTIQSEELFYTNMDDVTSMAIVVYEDTAPAEDLSINRRGMKRLGGTTLHGIPKAKRGQEKVKVTFHVDQGNMLTVKAVSESMGLETTLSVDQLY